MLKETINGYSLEIYSSIDELPIERYMAFNRQLMIDSGVGSDMDDITTKVTKILRLIERDKDQAKLELLNLSGTLANALTEVSPKMGAFACLVKSVDGEPWEDLSIEGVKELTNKINSVPKTWIDKVIKKVRRLLRRECGDEDVLSEPEEEDHSEHEGGCWRGCRG